MAEREKETIKKRPQYTLDELLAQCDPEAPVSDELKAWDEAPAQGDEPI